MAKKAVDRNRHVVGQVGLSDALTIDLQPGGAAGWRHAGQQDAVIRPAGL